MVGIYKSCGFGGWKSSLGKLAVMSALHQVIMMVSYVPGLWKTWRFHVYTNEDKTVQLCANIWTWKPTISLVHSPILIWKLSYSTFIPQCIFSRNLSTLLSCNIKNVIWMLTDMFNRDKHPKINSVFQIPYRIRNMQF